jgi:hypothetical protein
MPSNRLGMLGMLAALPALAQVTNGSITPEAKTQIVPRQHAPMRFHKLRFDGTLESDNWSGYAVTGSSFTHVRGTWTVPTVDCGLTPNTFSAFWLGLDGLTSSTVEQIGTDSDCNGTIPSYYAWYEFAPNTAILIDGVSISPGDQVSASVGYSNGEFTLTITNENTGQSYSKTARFSGAKRSSAEWIAEAPCCTSNGSVLPLSDFAIVFFGSGHSTDASTAGPISNFGRNVQEITMAGSTGKNEAVASPLTSGGTSFTVTWRSE